MINVTAQLVRLQNDPKKLWYVNVIYEDGRDYVSEIGYPTEKEGRAALREWIIIAKGEPRTVH